jgi:5'-nucleotidase
MEPNIDKKLVIAISSRALFDLAESHLVYETQGIAAYCAYQMENENRVLERGVAFSLVEKLLALNKDVANPQVEIILLSRNSADTGLRIFNSIQHYGLDITRAAFTSGRSSHRYISAFGAHLFLSSDQSDVKMALADGHAAATILPSNIDFRGSGELRIAFDGDAVLFSDASERIFKQQGLQAFSDSEKAAANTPMMGGPFKNLLAALHRIQANYPPDQAPIRTALITARSAPAHERVIKTLRAWNIRIDEAMFLGGMQKGPFLKAFGADIFFDDQKQHCDSAREHVATGHVPYGVANEATPIDGTVLSLSDPTLKPPSGNHIEDNSRAA